MSSQRHHRNEQRQQVLDAFDELVKFDDQQLPAAPIDDLTRRRQINAAVGQFQWESKKNNDKDTTGIPIYRRRPVFIGVTAGLAASICFAVVFAFLLNRKSSPVNGPIEPSRTALNLDEPGGNISPSPALTMDVLHTSQNCGELTQQFFDGQAIAQGQLIEIDRGEAVVGVAKRAKVLFHAKTRAVVEELNPSLFSLYLHQGEIFASVEPRIVQPTMIVSTPHGRVEVKGTVFAVAVNDDDVQVRVLRGRVRLSEERSRSRVLFASQTTTLGTTEVAQLTADDEQRMMRLTSFVDLLDEATHTVLEVHSRPSGAAVFLDGVKIGETPVVSSVRPGYRTLQLELAGHRVAMEQIALSRGARTSRTVDLIADNSDRAPPAIAKTTVKRRRPVEQATTADLLEQARLFRQQGKWARAARTYDEIRRTFPNTPAAQTAMVSAGTIRLKHLGQAKMALSHFNRYLKLSPRGALAPEAMWGKARALNALGDLPAERKTLKRFVGRYPDSPWGQRARERLARIEN